MQIKAAVDICFEPKVIAKWNKEHRVQFDGREIIFNYLKDYDEFLQLREFYEIHKVKGFTAFREVFYLRFAKKEYLNMDKLLFSPSRQISRLPADIAKSYAITKCEKCGQVMDLKKTAPLVFSEDPFDKDNPDPLDYGALRNSKIVLTGYNELLFCQKVMKDLSESGLKGFEFEEVIFDDKSIPQFYHMIIRNKIGEMIHPQLIKSKKVCKLCGNPQSISINYWEIFNPRRYRHPVLPEKDWRYWAMRFKPGDHLEDDILTGVEKLGCSVLKDPFIIISPKFHKVLSDNKIRGFTLNPIEIVREVSDEKKY
jgi:hypothetical protein